MVLSLGGLGLGWGWQAIKGLNADFGATVSLLQDAIFVGGRAAVEAAGGAEGDTFTACYSAPAMHEALARAETALVEVSERLDMVVNLQRDKATARQATQQNWKR